ncbi:MAG: NADH-quinone oxidoreductase subunit [Acidobacteriota bacterium]|jgi:NADH-quinone oxidoreductase subunit E|nr:NADH-quinone oxidoreductase subunit [Acidobacteriota bacterium]MDT7780333.1 NADH-quinone oxidoreductase subunit [Acidobacteriota bacterium]
MSQQFTPNNPLPQEAKVPQEIATFSAEVEAEIDRHLAKYPVKRSAILPLMFIVQRERGYLDPPGVTYLADRLGVRITDIWEVATFYSMINIEPVGKYHFQICKTLSCKILGANKITEHCTQRLGIKAGETTADGMFSLSEVECLGSCGTAPMMQIGFDFHENLTTEKVDELIEKCKSGELSNGVR